jgi:hypothetical protein
MLRKLLFSGAFTLALVGVAVSQAQACFYVVNGARTIAVEICSYNNDGTGGYYIADVINLAV